MKGSLRHLEAASLTVKEVAAHCGGSFLKSFFFSFFPPLLGFDKYFHIGGSPRLQLLSGCQFRSVVIVMLQSTLFQDKISAKIKW